MFGNSKALWLISSRDSWTKRWRGCTMWKGRDRNSLQTTTREDLQRRCEVYTQRYIHKWLHTSVLTKDLSFTSKKMWLKQLHWINQHFKLSAGTAYFPDHQRSIPFKMNRMLCLTSRQTGHWEKNRWTLLSEPDAGWIYFRTQADFSPMCNFVLRLSKTS